MPICLLVAAVLGGIYGGLFTPTEAGGAGALAAFLIGLARRELSVGKFWEVALETGRVTAAICFLLMAAKLYSQMLTLSGLPYAVGQWLQTAGLSFPVVLVGYLLVVIVLGCFLNSLSIMLIVLPFVLPVIDGFHINLIWFGLITIIAIEIGLITPPLGVAVFVVKANLEDQRITAWQIFPGHRADDHDHGAGPGALRAVPMAVAGAGQRRWLDLVVARAPDCSSEIALA